MLIGRSTELSSLEESYKSDKNSLTILYGRSNIGKTTLIREFVKDKKCVYYSAALASDKEQLELFNNNLKSQIAGYEEATDYMKLFSQMDKMESEVKIIVIEEFQNVVKQNKNFMNAITALVKENLIDSKVMVICTSSSISWIENNLVSSIGVNAYTITAFLKLKELSFVDTVRMFKKYSVPDCMLIFAITGGVPGYMTEFDDGISVKENICNNILKPGKMLRHGGIDYIGEELRETSLYNTILYCISNGEYKLNELHTHTGFGRDKISVYLKNLIEREIVDKIFSFDAEGNEHTRKGLYRIKAGYIEFWYRYIYGHESQLQLMSTEAFYDNYIADSIDNFAAETFVKVGTEFIELLDEMGKLQIKIDRRGRWWGKNGNIDIIACNEENCYVIGKCNWLTDVFTFAMFEELMYNVNLAGIGKDYIYLFSRGTFDNELKEFAKENTNVQLVSLSDL